MTTHYSPSMARRFHAEIQAGIDQADRSDTTSAVDYFARVADSPDYQDESPDHQDEIEHRFAGLLLTQLFVDDQCYILKLHPFSFEKVCQIHNQIEALCERIAENPEIGPLQTELPCNYRSLAQLDWVVFYRIHNDQVEILRVLQWNRSNFRHHILRIKALTRLEMRLLLAALFISSCAYLLLLFGSLASIESLLVHPPYREFQDIQPEQLELIEFWIVWDRIFGVIYFLIAASVFIMLAIRSPHTILTAFVALLRYAYFAPTLLFSLLAVGCYYMMWIAWTLHSGSTENPFYGLSVAVWFIIIFLGFWGLILFLNSRQRPRGKVNS